MGSLFHDLLVQPLFNLLVILYKYVTFEDLGLAIIALTIIVRFVLYPIFYRGLKSQAVMQKLQPEIARVQAQHKGNKEKQALALMEVYKANKVNPFASMLYIFAQLPILIAIYRIFFNGLTTESFSDLYSFISAPAAINHEFLGFLDVTKPSMVIVAIAVVAQYFQGRSAMAKTAATGAAAGTAKFMVYLGPLLTLLILPSLSAGIGLYWITSAVFSIFQQQIINKQLYGTEPSGKS